MAWLWDIIEHFWGVDIVFALVHFVVQLLNLVSRVLEWVTPRLPPWGKLLLFIFIVYVVNVGFRRR